MHRTTSVSPASVIQLASRKNMKRDFNFGMFFSSCNVFFGIFENTAITTRSQKDERNSQTFWRCHEDLLVWTQLCHAHEDRDRLREWPNLFPLVPFVFLCFQNLFVPIPFRRVVNIMQGLPCPCNTIVYQENFGSKLAIIYFFLFKIINCF
jgi:hypothetical protein